MADETKSHQGPEAEAKQEAVAEEAENGEYFILNHSGQRKELPGEREEKIRPEI